MRLDAVQQSAPKVPAGGHAHGSVEWLLCAGTTHPTRPAAGRTQADGSSKGVGGVVVGSSVGSSVLRHVVSELCSNGGQGPMLCLFGMEARCAVVVDCTGRHSSKVTAVQFGGSRHQ